ncbi:hypothetical protein AB0N19_38430, partial [Streptomyces sp. NPDC051132]|uniref:hypothetical protein n=1 Tax=Streptomyces sp. NPDC051132 TaxID=3155667 RepID=UPI00341F9187
TGSQVLRAETDAEGAVRDTTELAPGDAPLDDERADGTAGSRGAGRGERAGRSTGARRTREGTR